MPMYSCRDRRFNLKMTGFRGRLALAAILVLLLLLYCEFLHYFVVLLQCTWPRLQASGTVGLGSDPEDLKVMFLADTHLLGFREGNWFDKLRRCVLVRCRKLAFLHCPLFHHCKCTFFKSHRAFCDE